MPRRSSHRRRFPESERIARCASLAWPVPLIVAALLLGGASQDAPIQRLAIELISLPYLVVALARLRLTSLTDRTSAILLLAVLAVPLLQLVPLPPGLWRGLPGRAPLAASLALAGVAPSWSPMTLTQDETLRCVTFLLYPLTVVLTVRQLRPEQARALVAALLATALLSLLLGGLQAVGPLDSPLYFYGGGTWSDAPGLFANRNHQASLLLTAVPLTAGLALALRPPGEAGRTAAVATAIALGLLVVGLAGVRSRAGILLTLPALAGAVALLWRGAFRGGRAMLALPAAIGLLLAGGLVAQFGMGGIAERFEPGAASDTRLTALPAEIRAAKTYFPLGSGLGSFRPVYNSVEPLDTLEPAFLNQAHNEYVEIGIETGLLGYAVLLPFLVWFGLMALRVWRAQGRRELHLARAATVVIGLLLAHSAFDYPLRTPALAGVFALACGLLWREAAETQGRTRRRVPPSASERGWAETQAPSSV